MAITSVWFLSGARVLRMDLAPEGPRWTATMGVATVLPALAAIGVSGHETAERIGGGSAVSGHEVVLDGIRIDLSRGGATVSRRFRGDVPNDEFAPVPVDVTMFTVTGSGETQELFFPAVRMPNGLVVAFRSEGPFQTAGFQTFDPDTRTTDGVVRPLDEAFAPLVEAGFSRFDAVWTTTGDPDDWVAAHATGDVSTGALRALVDAAAAVGDLDALALTLICDLESGLRPDAFHPLGRYGLLQLDAAALEAAGWTDPPAALLTAPPAVQAPVIAQHLADLDFASPENAGELWASLLMPGHGLPALPADTVVAGRDGPRPGIYATHVGADVDGDGILTVGNLTDFFMDRFGQRRATELEQRLRALR
jgi:hypothetical protein